jgi:hypothetical protein
MTLKEDKEKQLSELLESMDVPEMRRGITLPSNLFWLGRNLAIRNGSHKDFKQTNDLVNDLINLNR